MTVYPGNAPSERILRLMYEMAEWHQYALQCAALAKSAGLAEHMPSEPPMHAYREERLRITYTGRKVIDSRKRMRGYRAMAEDHDIPKGKTPSIKRIRQAEAREANRPDRLMLPPELKMGADEIGMAVAKAKQNYVQELNRAPISKEQRNQELLQTGGDKIAQVDPKKLLGDL